MDGFLQDDFVGTIRKGMTMEQIDNMVSRQLRMMQEDYEQCQKYEDPNYQGVELKLQGKFEKNELEDGTQFKDDKETINQSKQNENLKENIEDNKNEENIKKEENAKQVKNEDNQNEDEEEEDDDNRCVEDYYQPLDNDADQNEEDEEEEDWSEFQKEEDFKDLPPERDPRKKEIDVEKIKQIMNSFTLKPPSWAQDKNIWEQKVKCLINDISQ
ncbi:hypothetical protein TTHERM_00809410 (macronuclear) [Tetrahymena thermophila SB210]|uniref:Uncharacterized protein n=1 Tax=Tetrahymena thermophila (strain SB210) TaxID=312017 RepID=Q233N3_TETTS|nr:hypothetical protein TTHERM_00809410 [Tetrahymena thermophila SB210]EAR91796.2 hypothetical protein TTHERM_00809410 [Tetrahymena thermophila SB210]|eukprot:XP_001012041.2 hypothetical protein TTHERM_00809410 [Tetrahymena thermophila SB210]